MDVAELLLLVRADAAPALRGLAEVRTGLAETEASTSRFGALKAVAMGVAVGLVAVAGTVAAVGGMSLKMAADFQSSMTMIHTQAGAFDEDLNKLSKSVLALSAEVGFAPDVLVHMGLYHIESAGFRGAKALDMLTQAAKLAKIGHADLETVTQAVIGTMAAFERQNISAADAAAQLNAIVGTGDMRMDQLAKGIATGILPSAANFGLTLKDVGAALATLTDNVTPADEAATRLRMTITLLGAPTGAAAKALKSVGIEATAAGDIVKSRDEFFSKFGIHLTDLAADMRKPNGLMVALQDIKSHMEKAGVSATEQGAILAKAFGGGRSSAAILTLLGEFDRLQSKYKAIDEGAKKFGASWTETQSTFTFQWQRAQAVVDAAAVSIGTKLLPMATQATAWFASMVPRITPFVNVLADKLPAAISGLGNIVGQLGNAIGGPLHDGFDAVIKITTAVAGAFASGQANADGLRIVLAILHTNLQIVAGGLQLIANHLDVIVPVLAGVTAGWLAWQAAMAAENIIAIGRAVGILVGLLMAQEGVTGPLTAAQWLLDAALAANPVGLVVIAIGALVAGFILAYNHVGWFRDAVNSLWKEIGVLWSWFADHLVPILAVVAGIITFPLGPAIVLLVTHFSEVKKVIGEVWDAFKHLGDWLDHTFGGIVRGVGDALSGIGRAVGVVPKPPSAPGIAPAPVSVAAAVRDAATETTAAAAAPHNQALANAHLKVADALNVVAVAQKTVDATTNDTSVPGVEKHKAALGQLVVAHDHLRQAREHLATTIKKPQEDLFARDLGKLPGQAAAGLIKFNDEVSKWLDKAFATVDQFGGQILGGMGKAIGGVVDFVKRELPKIPEQFGFTVGLIVGFWMKLPDRFWDVLVNVGKQFVKWGAQLLGWITTEVPKLITAIVGFFDKAPGRIWDALLAVLGTFGRWWNQLSGWIGAEVPKLVDGVVGYFRQLPGRVWDAVIAVKDQLARWASDIGNWIATEIPKLADAIVGFFTSIPGRLVKVGGDIINGIINGVKEAVGKIGGPLGDAIRGIVDGFSRGLKASSPSLLFAVEVGEKMIMAGVAKGVAESTAVHDAVNRKFSDLSTISLPNIAVSAARPQLQAGIAGAIRTGSATAQATPAQGEQLSGAAIKDLLARLVGLVADLREAGLLSEDHLRALVRGSGGVSATAAAYRTG